MRPLPLSRPARSVAITLALLSACGGRGEDEDDDGGSACSQSLGLTSDTISSTGETARLTFEVPAGTRSFLLSARSAEGGYVYVSELSDPSGQDPAEVGDWMYGQSFLSSGVLPLHDETAFNWPVRDVDGELEAGTWTVGLSVLGNSGAPQEGVQIEVAVHANRDSRLESGCVSARVVLAPEVAGDEALAAAVEQAVAAWQAVYQGIGVELQTRIETAEGLSDTLDHPSLGSEEYEALKADGEEEELVVVVGESVGGAGNGVLGEAGGIPGPLAPAARAVVAVGWLLHAGSDGQLDAVDIQGMGETMAHEVGHFVGLFHPVELDGYGNPSGYGDALDDTPSCGSSGDCLGQLGTNLMYPYRTCYDADCERQDQLTAQQGAVVQRYTGTR
ncbi:hypothetical protein L6R53_24260 [Myxococcota bacterium]|nr:hypothetical protein [Myxococcota bacterium]